MAPQQRLSIVSDNETEIENLRAEFHAFREEVRIWQAVTCGVVAGLSLLIGAMIVIFKT